MSNTTGLANYFLSCSPGFDWQRMLNFFAISDKALCACCVGEQIRLRHAPQPLGSFQHTLRAQAHQLPLKLLNFLLLLAHQFANLGLNAPQVPQHHGQFC